MQKKSTLRFSKKQKEAIGLLSVGSFLEAFDLFLYVHMATLLNELFFPTPDPFTAKQLSALAFCATVVFRPFGALLFGYIGDSIGRKATIIITTMMMAVACLVMATLPTYAQIGITASWAVILCRVVQSLSALGERGGAELYLTETIKPPLQYMAVGCLTCATDLGGVFAVGVSTLATVHSFNWRWAFLIGAAAALLGAVVRTRLKETPAFVDAKRKKNKDRQEQPRSQAAFDSPAMHHSTVKAKTSLAYFLIRCASPVSFYLIYIYCGDILKDTLGYTAHEVSAQNFIVGLFQLAATLLITHLSKRIHPLQILKFKANLFPLFVLASPLLLAHISTPTQLLLFQVSGVIIALTTLPAAPVFYRHFPTLKRFTYASLLEATAKASMAVVASFGLVYLCKHFGYWGFPILTIPMLIGHRWGLQHFEQLELAPLKVGATTTLRTLPAAIQEKG